MDVSSSKTSLFFLGAIMLISSGSCEELTYCKGGTISNQEDYFRIKKCDVIEGHLIIAFNIAISEEEWIRFGYLQVREITDYLIIYLVENLTSLDLLFPNLCVIRGNDLFQNYSFIVFGIRDLKEIRLRSLTAILRGSVNIQHNSVLTPYANTIDWNYITKWNNESHCSHPNFVQNIPDFKTCSEDCKRVSKLATDPENALSGSQGRCWSHNDCQRVCPESPPGFACTLSSETCDEECVGGCYAPQDATTCFACRGFRYKKKCDKSCWSLYELDNYRCVTNEECRKMSGRKLLEEWNGRRRRMCVMSCPTGYLKKVVQTSGGEFASCVKCKGKCPKICKGGLIDSLAMAQKFKGCMLINGSLEVRLFRSNSVAELNSALGAIEEVEGFLRVFKSEVLTSLDFFHGLKSIRGKELWKGKYALVVNDNDNLQELWKSKLVIDNGEVTFFGNPKLCPQVIEGLVGKDVWTDRFPILNGNKKACHINDRFEVELVALEDEKGAIVARFEWSQFTDVERLRLAGFHLYYKRTEPSDDGYYSDSEWKIKFIKYRHPTSPYITIKIADLIPATEYSVYLETQTSDSSYAGFQSKIFHGSTRPYYPSLPTNLRVTKRGSDFIEISWNPPDFPNGIIDHYLVHLTPFAAEPRVNLCDDEHWLSVRGSNSVIQKGESVSRAVATSTRRASVPKRCLRQNDESRDSDVIAEDKREEDNLANGLSRAILYKQVRQKREVSSSRGLNPSKEGLSKIFPPIGPEGHFLPPMQNKSNLDYDQLLNVLKENVMKLPLTQLVDYIELMGLDNEHFCQLLRLVYRDLRRHPNQLYLETCPEESASPPNPDKDRQLHLRDKRKRRSATNPEESSLPRDQIVFGRSLNVTNLTASSYEVKIKACQKPPSGNTYCLPTSIPPCKCSLTSEIMIVHNYQDEEEGRVQNVTVKEVEEGRVLIRWDPPRHHHGNVVAFDIFVEGPLILKRFCQNSTEAAVDFSAPGNYTVVVAAFSDTSTKLSAASEPAYFSVTRMGGFPYEMVRKKQKVYVIVVVAFVCALLILVAVLVYTKRNKKAMEVDITDDLEATLNSKYKFLSKYAGDEYPPWKEYLEKTIDPKFIHSKANFKMSGFMGEGKFGVVLRGMLKVTDGTTTREIRVAVKQLKKKNVTDDDLTLQLIDEASLMLTIRTYHLVRTYGIMSDNFDLSIVMEEMTLGNLSTYMKDNRKADNIFFLFSETQIMKFCVQIADGMAYLVGRNIVHMDLAARNCLLDVNLNVKVSDFGMSRVIQDNNFVLRENKPVPIRWMPPEYFIEEKFSAKSDVWSFGILLWEIVTAGGLPYKNLVENEVEKKIMKGMTLITNIPPWVPPHLASLMAKCWHIEQDRPSFHSIVSYLLKFTDNDFKTQFMRKSYYFGGGMREEEEFYSLSSLLEEETVTPRTPLTLPGVLEPATTTGPLDLDKKDSLNRLKDHLIFIKDAFSFKSRSFPFLSSPSPLIKGVSDFKTHKNMYEFHCGTSISSCKPDVLPVDPQTKI